MPFYKDHVYPQLVSMLGNPEPILKVRQRIVSLAQGKVLADLDRAYRRFCHSIQQRSVRHHQIGSVESYDPLLAPGCGGGYFDFFLVGGDTNDLRCEALSTQE